LQSTKVFSFVCKLLFAIIWQYCLLRAWRSNWKKCCKKQRWTL
jgi:hypothetical protein